MIDALTLARAIHVLALVHWIGGVCLVTTIVLPQARRRENAAAALDVFESFERGFAAQARVSILLVGLSGVYMLYRLDAWERLSDPLFWWLDLMIAVWFAFAVVIYLLEPLLLHEYFRRLALGNPERAFAVATRLHQVALTVSAIAIGAGVLGAHGALY